MPVGGYASVGANSFPEGYASEGIFSVHCTNFVIYTRTVKFAAPHPSERKTAAEMEQKIAPAQNRRPAKTLGAGRERGGRRL